MKYLVLLFVLSCGCGMQMDRLVQGIYHIQVSTVNPRSFAIGTGFAVGPYEIVTAKHVISGKAGPADTFAAAGNSGTGPGDPLLVEDWRSPGPRDVMILTTNKRMSRHLIVRARQVSKGDKVCYTQMREFGVPVTRCGKVEFQGMGRIIFTGGCKPGASGSPIHTESGVVVGMVTMCSSKQAIGLTAEAWL